MIEQIKKLLSNGYTYLEISKELGVNIWKLRKIIKKNDIKKDIIITEKPKKYTLCCINCKNNFKDINKNELFCSVECMDFPDVYFIRVCSESSSMLEASKKLNIKFSTFKKKALQLNCYNTNQNWNKGKTFLTDVRIKRYYKYEDYFCENSSVTRHSVKNLILKLNLLKYKCKECGINNWNGKILSLHLDHINGIRNDNRLENLRFLCPNCHSQTDTYCVKNLNVKNINDIEIENIIENVENSYSLSELFSKLGLLNNKKNKLKLERIIYNYNLKFLSFPIFEKRNIKLKKEKTKSNCICGNEIRSDNKSGFCKDCYKQPRKVENRPSLDILVKEVKEYGYSEIGRKYGVSDNSIRKWIK